MNKQKEVRIVSVKKSGPYFAIYGNQGILERHIKYFEEKAEKETQVSPNDFSTCPNFYVWLRLYTELITNVIFWQYFKSTNKGWANVADKTYSKIVNILRKELGKAIKDNDTLEKLMHKIKLTIELRHCIMHGGIPNIMREIGKSHGFGDVKKEEIDSILDPNNLQKTKAFFESTYSEIKELLKVDSIVITS